MTNRFIIKHKYILLCIIFVIAVLSLFVVFQTRQDKLRVQSLKVNPSEIQNPSRIELEGKVICLPYQDTTGLPTLECVIGLMDANG